MTQPTPQSALDHTSSGLEAEISIPNQSVRFRMSERVAIFLVTSATAIGFVWVVGLLWTAQQPLYQLPPAQDPELPPVEQKL